MNSEGKPDFLVEDLELFRRSGPVYRARKVMGLLLPDETLRDFYRFNLEWKQKRDSNGSEDIHTDNDQRRSELQVCGSQPLEES